MNKQASGDIWNMFKGVPPKNIIIQVDDLPAKTLEQHILAGEAQEKKQKQ